MNVGMISEFLKVNESLAVAQTSIKVIWMTGRSGGQPNLQNPRNGCIPAKNSNYL